MKKIISLAIALCLMLTVCSTGLMSLTAAAAQTIEGSEVTWSFDNITKILTFGGTGDIPDYDTYKDEGGNATMPWAGIDYTSVVFGDGITGIGSYVFYKNYTMESLTVPATITKLGKGAFFECKGLRSITVEGGITKVEEQTFSGCSSLETVNLPETVTEIGAKAFYKCSAAKTVALPDSVKTIGDSAFHSCILLKTFEAPASLEKIADRAFYCCESLETLTLNDNIAEIGISAFDGCIKLTAVSFPSSVRTISEAAFSGCSKLATVEFADGITTIGDQAFHLCTSLKSVNIPHTVETIGKKAFGYGKSGSKIDGFAITGYDETAAQSYATENEFTFNSLGKYFPKSGTISETLTWEVSDDGVLTFTGTGAIGDSTADTIPEYMLGNPKSIVLCEGITAVGAYAFLSDCKEIAVPKSVTAIGEKAFGYTVDGDGNVVKVEDFTITGYEGSDAERYATENEFTMNKLQLDLGFKLGEEAKICTFDEENRIITVYDKEATLEKILADFVIGDDLTVEPLEKVATGANLVTKDGEAEVASYTIVVIGDVNGDGNINSADALLILQHSVEAVTLSGANLAAANVDGNDTINSSDALAVLQISVDNKTPADYYPATDNPGEGEEPGEGENPEEGGEPGESENPGEGETPDTPSDTENA